MSFIQEKYITYLVVHKKLQKPKKFTIFEHFLWKKMTNLIQKIVELAGPLLPVVELGTRADIVGLASNLLALGEHELNLSHPHLDELFDLSQRLAVVGHGYIVGRRLHLGEVNGVAVLEHDTVVDGLLRALQRGYERAQLAQEVDLGHLAVLARQLAPARVRHVRQHRIEEHAELTTNRLQYALVLAVVRAEAHLL